MPAAAQFRRAPAAWLLGAALAGLWLAFAPPTPDLAAQVFRVELFASDGFALYDSHWYGGHLLPAYGVLFQPLGALLGVRLAGALATAAAIVLFDRLARPLAGDRAWLAGLWFAAGAGLNLVSARLTFALGLALGLGALLAMRRGRVLIAAGVGAACSLASPLAGLFLALAVAAWWAGERRRELVPLGAATLVPLAALELAFPEGGTFDFSTGRLVVLLAILAFGFLLIPRAQTVLRIGFALYATGAVLAYAVPSPLGANWVRLGLVLAGPVLACVVTGRRAIVLAALAPLLLLWSAMPTVGDLRAAGGPAAAARYYAPLESFLASHATQPPARVEIPFTRGHWEATYVGKRFLLARGWERQVDVARNPLFYPSRPAPLDATAYLRWLRDKGVRYVALADAPLDFSATAERVLIVSRPPYLSELWRSAHWRVYELHDATALLEGPGRLVSVATESFRLIASRPGSFLVRLQYSPYWRLPDGAGCARRAAGGWTRLEIRRAGPLTVGTGFTLAGLGGGPSCG